MMHIWPLVKKWLFVFCSDAVQWRRTLFVQNISFWLL